MSKLSDSEVGQLSSHRQRAYAKGGISAEAVRMRGWCGKPKAVAKVVPKKVKRAPKADAEEKS